VACWISGGPRWKPGSIDPDGHRTWNVEFTVQSDDMADGPATAVQTPGLPLFGDVYQIGNDVDVWAWFRAGPTSIVPQSDKGGNQFFYISYVATTRPPDAGAPGASGGKDDKGARKKCADQRIEDPLSEPPAVSGSSVRYSREEEFDKDGKPFRYTSFEKILGQFREFDAHREQVVIEQNVLNLERSLVKSLLDKLNDAPLWDMPARCWKLSDWDWQRKSYGTCGFYYTRKLTFECDALEVPPGSNLYSHPVLFQWLVAGPDGRYWLPGHDKYVLDWSAKVLNGHWLWSTGVWVPDNVNGATPVSTNPNHYTQALDRNHNPVRLILSRTSKGQPIFPTAPPNEDDDANYLRMQRYAEGNMYQLGIPASID
jgi:hypothetical protein